MEDEYYTPEIEEFHVDFEYELLCESNEWREEIFVFSDFDWAAMEKEYMNMFRVKYLNREDIESLGWGIDGRGDFQLNNCFISWHTGNERPLWTVISRENGEILFDGELKNKSELKRLMKQLNIIK